MESTVLRKELIREDPENSGDDYKDECLIHAGNPSTSASLSELSKKVNCFVVVISPLNSLMEDQVKSLEARGVGAVALDQCPMKNSTVFQTICDGKYQVVYSSPEALLSRNRGLLKNEQFKANIVAVFIDESHCIKKWGSKSKEVDAFRHWYGKLGEIRSMINVPLIAMTATATKEMKSHIISNLDLTEPFLLVKSPEKTNIRYSVIELPHKNLELTFMPLITNLKEKWYAADKLIIFCRTIDNTRPLFQLFKKHIKVANPLLRPYAKFHAKTEGDLKKFLTKEFTDPNSNVRILMATMAYGMGVDCKALYDVIPFGPPNALDDYFQESGRAGRDGGLSNATLIKYNRSLQPPSLTAEIKAYCNNKTVCRRKILLSQFDENDSSNPVMPKHLCCDICHRECDCGACIDEPEYPWYIREVKESCQKIKVRCSLNYDGKALLKQKLTDIQTHELEYFSDNNDSLSDGSEAGGYDVDTVDTDSAYDESEASDTMDI
ncbi:bifunctional 3'-5' exonuclease/ATP-dependent helicase WRN-like [Clytia hemisphaerica]|uniref:bifunctional 3'-5' exonuclease/ATP-dependent helicase WRN-like n=1 Tax=Clytia hemisphaerica TaxID=252671 RepID=UPI0034D4BF55